MAQRIPTKKHKKTSSLIVPSDLPKLKTYNSVALGEGKKDAMSIVENISKNIQNPYLDEMESKFKKQSSYKLDKTRSINSNKSK